jgi:hypothetical protein
MAIKFTERPPSVSKERLAQIAAIPDRAIDTSDAPDGSKRGRPSQVDGPSRP